MSVSETALAPGVAEEFEAGGFWSCRQLNKWLLAAVTLAYGIGLGAEVIYEVLLSETSPAGLIFMGLISVGCVILLWVCVTYAVAAGLIVLVATLFAEGVGISVLLALLLAGLAALTTTRAFRRSTLAAMIAWAGALGGTVPDPATGTLVFLGVSLSALVSYGIGSSFRRTTFARQQSDCDLEEVRRQYQKAKSAERRSIARDLHDVVAHDITIIAMQSRAARMKDTDLAYREAVTVIGDSSRAALNDLRRMLALLKDQEVIDDDSGPMPSVNELDIGQGVEDFSGRLQSLGITVRVKTSGDLTTISRPVSAALYRMLQECTTNVVKYAGEGTVCWIDVECTGENVQLCVTNTVQEEGPGSSSLGDSGIGLIGVGDRARAFGGTCEAGFDDQGRWRVCVDGVKKA